MDCGFVANGGIPMNILTARQTLKQKMVPLQDLSLREKRDSPALLKNWNFQTKNNYPY